MSSPWGCPPASLAAPLCVFMAGRSVSMSCIPATRRAHTHRGAGSCVHAARRCVRVAVDCTGAQCLLSNSLVPGCVLAADPADWAKHPHSVGLGSAAQSRRLPGLSDASLSSPAQSNLLAPDWHNWCVCLCMCVLSVCAHFSLRLLFCHLSSLFSTLVIGGLSRPSLALLQWPSALLSCQAKLTVALTT